MHLFLPQNIYCAYERTQICTWTIAANVVLAQNGFWIRGAGSVGPLTAVCTAALPIAGSAEAAEGPAAAEGPS